MKRIVITCADNMSDETYSYICDRLKENSGNEKVVIKKIVAPELIGGFTVAVDGKLYDMSIKTQISMMKKHITKD